MLHYRYEINAEGERSNAVLRMRDHLQVPNTALRPVTTVVLTKRPTVHHSPEDCTQTHAYNSGALLHAS